MSAHAKAAGCPPQEQLERLLDDCLETIEDSTVARHVETCAECQARLERLLAGGLSTPSPAQSLCENPSPQPPPRSGEGEKRLAPPLRFGEGAGGRGSGG